MAETVVVTGGAGYIGSVIVDELVRAGFAVVVIDKQPPRGLPLQHQLLRYLQADYGDRALLVRELTGLPITAVIHCAAFIEVGESVSHPARYYDNNVAKLLALLDAMRELGVATIVASSSSAVYGTHLQGPISEDALCLPVSPYGRTKLMLEMIIKDYAAAYGMRYGLLRYFNVAGALPERGLGELHSPETHLIPRALAARYSGEPLVVGGSDYATPDGTCIRDYVHVGDIATAHRVVVDYIHTTSSSVTLNVGSGKGSSVLDILHTIGQVTGGTVPYRIGARRAGDPAELRADIRSLVALGWRPVHSDLQEIIRSADEFLRHNNSKLVRAKIAQKLA